MPNPKNYKTLRQRGPIRDPYDRVLVVTEGEKTEPLYFKELINSYRINTANVQIVGAGADPHFIVKKAVELRESERRNGEQFDRVYCVFDRDQHENFEFASKLALREGLLVARSWPCFEFWLLLHFQYSRKPFMQTGRRSACDTCIDVLRQHLVSYNKVQPNIFQQLQCRLEQAKSHAAETLQEAILTDENNPSTEIHKLVDDLQNIKRTT